MPLSNEYLFPYRYRRQDSRLGLISKFDSVLKRSGLKRISRQPKTFNGFRIPDIEEAFKVLFEDEDCGKLPLHIRKQLSPVKMSKLTAPVKFIEYDWSDRRNRFVSLKAASSNSFPALSIEIWLKRRIMLFGAFVTVRAEDWPATKLLSNEIRTTLQLPCIH